MEGKDENNQVTLLYRIQGETSFQELSIPFVRKGLNGAAKSSSGYYTW